ncbi:hypothetical protein GW17_00023358 [Ensete ventricosum]|nr:hypothetical protein GW17_00023358 [Ensete ventricosum]RZR76658.1 hypothetical protein BHM03_00001502 [Ensete ventricosum]
MQGSASTKRSLGEEDAYLELLVTELMPQKNMTTRHNSQANDSPNARVISALEGQIEYLSYGITSSIIVTAQEVGNVGDCKCDSEQVSPADDDRYADGANDSFRAVLVRRFRFLCLKTTS